MTVAILITVQTVRAYTLAPEFSFTDTDGKTYTLSSFRGKIVLLEFFSTSCSVCNNELTQLRTVYNQFPTDFVMISISIDTGHDTSSYVATWKIAHSIPSGWIMAGYETGGLSAYNYKYNGKFCGSGIPQIYIIDQAGYIRNCHIGTPSSSTLITEIGQLISPTTPTITVTSPNGGENWVRGTTHAITWTSTGSVGAYVKIELLKSGMVKGTVPSTANDGSYSWTIGTSNLGTDYEIRITSTSNPAITDSSDNNFTITDGGATGTITVTSPNGGESWVRGTTHAITWTWTGSVGANVYIQLLKSGVVKGTITTANTGSYSWTIGLSNLGTDYKIKITDTSNSAITDTSDNNFAITADGETGTLTIISPNGGESWKRGTAHTITWSKSGSPGSYVKIELLKGEVVNSVVTSSTANDGSYNWKISSTQTAGTDYWIKITSTTYPSVTDSSNASFTIR